MRPTKRGFTLIEILVVLTIISISLGFALLTFSDLGASRRVSVAAEQFLTYIKLAQQRAILESKTLGIGFTKQRYQTYRLEDGSSWTLLSSGGFQARSLPEDLVITFQGYRKMNRKNPAIIIDASGELQTFELHFGTTKNSDMLTLLSKANGQLILQPSKPND